MFYFRATMAKFWSLLHNLVWIFGKSLHEQPVLSFFMNNQYCLFFKLQKPRTTRSHNRNLRVLLQLRQSLFKELMKQFETRIITTVYLFLDKSRNFLQTPESKCYNGLEFILEKQCYSFQKVLILRYFWIKMSLFLTVKQLIFTCVRILRAKDWVFGIIRY